MNLRFARTILKCSSFPFLLLSISSFNDSNPQRGLAAISIGIFFLGASLFPNPLKTWLATWGWSLVALVWGWIKPFRRRLAIGALWLLILVIGFIGTELYFRYKQGYVLWKLPLQKINFFEEDRIKVWNRLYYNQRISAFDGWPIQIELFDSSEPTPQYLFKPN